MPRYASTVVLRKSNIVLGVLRSTHYYIYGHIASTTSNEEILPPQDTYWFVDVVRFMTS
jgi:hypothetical protein